MKMNFKFWMLSLFLMSSPALSAGKWKAGEVSEKEAYNLYLDLKDGPYANPTAAALIAAIQAAESTGVSALGPDSGASTVSFTRLDGENHYLFYARLMPLGGAKAEEGVIVKGELMVLGDAFYVFNYNVERRVMWTTMPGVSLGTTILPN